MGLGQLWNLAIVFRWGGRCTSSSCACTILRVSSSKGWQRPGLWERQTREPQQPPVATGGNCTVLDGALSPGSQVTLPPATLRWPKGKAFS